MSMKAKKVIGFIAVSIFILFSSSAAASVLQGFQGGTGYGSATSSSVGQALIVASTSPYLTYTLSPISTSTSQWTTTSTGIYYNGGNVGIGTTAPTNPMTVAGNGNFTGSLTASTAQFSGITNTGLASALVLSNSLGLETNYGGSTACASGNAVTTISATGSTTCAPFLLSYNVIGGTGISVSTTTTSATITNTGVTSFNTQTGAATYALTAGTGIGVSNTNTGATVTNTGVTSFNGATGTVTANIPTIATTTKGIFDAQPSTSTPDIMFYSESAYTIKRVDCVNSAVTGNTFTFSLIASSSVQSTATTTVMNGMTCNSTSTIQSTTTFNNASIPANTILQVNYSAASTTGAYVDIKY